MMTIEGLHGLFDGGNKGHRFHPHLLLKGKKKATTYRDKISSNAKVDLFSENPENIYEEGISAGAISCRLECHNHAQPSGG